MKKVKILYGGSVNPKNINELNNITEESVTGDIKGLKGATGFIKPEEWDSKKKSLEKNYLM